MDLCKVVSSWSKDKTPTRVGCVIVDDRNVVLSLGWNGFPRKVDDNKEERHERPLKYRWTEHAERNAIYNAASKGVALRGATLYSSYFPCTDCVRAIIQSGITKLIVTEPNWGDERWGDDFKIAKEMLDEAWVRTVWYEENNV
jgi:dCMP deaminase